MLKMFGGGSGPLYTGFSVKEEKSTKKGKKRYVWHGGLLITSIYLPKNVNENITKASLFEQGKLQIKGTIFNCFPVIHNIIA